MVQKINLPLLAFSLPLCVIFSIMLGIWLSTYTGLKGWSDIFPLLILIYFFICLAMLVHSLISHRIMVDDTAIRHAVWMKETDWLLLQDIRKIVVPHPRRRFSSTRLNSRDFIVEIATDSRSILLIGSQFVISHRKLIDFTKDFLMKMDTSNIEVQDPHGIIWPNWKAM